MNVEELRQLLERARPDLEVVVVLSQPGVGAVPSTPVAGADIGFDWNHGQLLLRPKEPVVRAPKTAKQLRAARDAEVGALTGRVTKLLQLLAAAMRLLSELHRAGAVPDRLERRYRSLERAIRERQ